MDILYTEFRDSKYRACPLLAQLVAAGHLGRKSGKGFITTTDIPRRHTRHDCR
jgi:3-hydroxyacyl-CoA dehydrogenase